MTGSPPRSRGRLLVDPISKDMWRITPAFAGKAPLSIASPMLSKDHPRVRGEGN